MGSEDERPPVEIPVSGELDLHTFAPADVSPLLDAYLDACLARGILQVRVIHGKGRGVLRAGVVAKLARDPRVLRLETGDESSGGWGATRVVLKRP